MKGHLTRKKGEKIQQHLVASMLLCAYRYHIAQTYRFQPLACIGTSHEIFPSRIVVGPLCRLCLSIAAIINFY